jgi:anion-transporting  ArsA/GET3 family ATPase
MSRMLVVAGKGGVGKTTVTAALARAAADTGHRVLVVSLDDRTTLHRMLGAPEESRDSYEPVRVASGLGPGRRGSVDIRTITAAAALQDYLATQGLAAIAKRLVSTGVVGVVSNAAPGIDDLLVLGKLKHLVGLSGPDGPHDLIVVDGPAAGHAVSFLQSPHAMATTVRGGPIRSQAIEVDTMLRDPDRCRVVLVSLPETTPVSELLDTRTLLAESTGVSFAPVVVNGFDSAPDIDELIARGSQSDNADLVEAARYRSSRCSMHATALATLADHGIDDIVTLPHEPTVDRTAKAFRRLVSAIIEQTAVEPGDH